MKAIKCFLSVTLMSFILFSWTHPVTAQATFGNRVLPESHPQCPPEQLPEPYLSLCLETYAKCIPCEALCPEGEKLQSLASHPDCPRTMPSPYYEMCLDSKPKVCR